MVVGVTRIRGGIKHSVKRLVGVAMRQRARFPRWANRAIDWVRWRMPASWLRLLTDRPVGATEGWDSPEVHLRPEVPHAPRRLFIGPANFAGQGYAWARCAESADVGAICFALSLEGGFGFPDDFSVPPIVYRRNRRWQEEQFAYVKQFSHVIIEAGRPLFADLFGLDPFREARALTAVGTRVAMMSHGRDSRDPARHAERYDWSPYRDADWEEVPRLQRQSRTFVEGLRRFSGPVFASTPDLLDDLPFATWCPVVVDPSPWQSTRPPLERDRPLVVHAPSNSRVKGSEYVDAALEPLHERKLIEYRRIERVPASEMPAIYRDADIVLDQFRLGSYGVAACEAMAAGRVVVGNVTEVVRERVRQSTGLELPIVQAEPACIGEVVERLIGERGTGARVSAAGIEFVERVHSGAFSARVLGGFLRGTEHA